MKSLKLLLHNLSSIILFAVICIAGISACSKPTAIAPECLTVTELPLITEVNVNNTSGNIELQIHLSPCGSEANNFKLEYLANDNNWQVPNDYYTTLSENSTNLPPIITWNSALDFFNQEKTVIIRITPLKNENAGLEFIVNDVTIDNIFTTDFQRLDKDITANPTTSFPQTLSFDNNVFLCWFDSRHGAASLYSSFSQDGGKSWLETDVRLDHGTNFKPLNPVSTILDSDNNFRVFWISKTGNNFSFYANGLDTQGSLLSEDAVHIISLPKEAEEITALRIAISGDNFIVAFSDNRNGNLQGRLLILSSTFEILKNIALGQIEDQYSEEYYIALYAEGKNIHTAFRRSGDECNLIYRKFSDNGLTENDETQLASYSITDPDSEETISCYLDPHFFALDDAVGLIHLSPLSSERIFITQKITADGKLHDLGAINSDDSSPLLSLALCQTNDNQTCFVWADSKDDNIYSIYTQLMNSEGNLLGTNTRLDIVDKDLMSYSPAISCSDNRADVLWMDYSFDTDTYYLQSSSFEFENQNTTHSSIMSGNSLGNPSNSYGVINTSDGFLASWHDNKLPSRSLTLATKEGTDKYKPVENRIPGSDKLTNTHASSPQISTHEKFKTASWLSSTVEGNKKFLSNFSDGSWLEANQLDLDDISDMTQQYDSEGNLHLLYQNGENIYLATYVDNTLIDTILINPNDESTFSQKQPQIITFEDSSNIVVLWRDIRNSIIDLYGRLYTKQTGWGKEFKINDDRGPNGSSINVNSYHYAVSSEGDIAIVYNGSSQGISILFVRTLKDYGQTLQTISNNLFRSLNTAIEFSIDWSDIGEYIALLFIAAGENSGNTIPYFTKSTDGGESFYGAVQLKNEENIYHQPQVFFTSADQINLLWFSSDQENKILSLESVFTADLGTSFSEPEIIFEKQDTLAAALTLKGCINPYGNGILLIQNIVNSSYTLDMLETRSYGWEWMNKTQLNPENTQAAQADLFCNDDGTIDIVYGITISDFQQIVYTNLP